nr:MAG TPA: hypothetical protein [Caudoviricetes sp.]
MEKKLKIEVPQGYEIDKEKSTFEEIVFKKIEPCNPTTWEEYRRCIYGHISYYCNGSREPYIMRTSSGVYNEFSTKGRVKQYVALGKLLQLRDYWVGDWKPDLPNFNNSVFAVFYSDISKVVEIVGLTYTNLPLTFPTKEMSQKFIDCFEDLIKEAYPLI